MVRRLLLAAAPFVLMGGLAGPAAAQPADDAIIEMRGPDAPRAAGPRIRLFISPMGEPFRGPDGFGTWFAGADANRDGTLTPAELRADGERFFHLLDANGDGAIDGFEIQAYERERVPEIAGLNFDEGGRRGGGRRGSKRGGAPSAEDPQDGRPDEFRGAGADGAARYSLLNIPQPVANCDEDGSGRVSLKEWDRAADRRFGMLDKAKAGGLTRDGLRPPGRR